MNLRFDPRAVDEREAALDGYAARVRRMPHACTVLESSVRKCNLIGYPLGLIYAEQGGDILILALAHLHRRSGYWRDRLSP